jgi:hypothetical protein
LEALRSDYATLTARQVGYLITEYSLSPLLIYNYAMSGSTVTDVRMQIESYFYVKAGSKPRLVPWTAENSLFGKRSPTTVDNFSATYTPFSNLGGD